MALSQETRLNFITMLMACLLNGLQLVASGNITDVEQLHAALLADYNKDVRPITNQSEAIIVDVKCKLRAIQELDEVKEEFSFTGALNLLWHDTKMTWNPTDYGGIEVVYVSYKLVWVPEIVLTTSADHTDTMAKEWQKVRYTYFGTASFTIADTSKVSCRVNVENFPFDQHVCRVVFSGWVYSHFEVSLKAREDTIGLSNYNGHSIWRLTNTEVVAHSAGPFSNLDLVFYLERKAGFNMISLVMPMLLMSFLNVLVFILVPDSGERMSYSITVLLAITVFMSILSDALPPISDPIPLITYKLMADMIISALITLVTTLNLRLHHTEEGKTVPGRLRAVYMLFHRSTASPRTIVSRVSNKVHVDVHSEMTCEHLEEQSAREEAKRSNNEITLSGGSVSDDVTWKDISLLVDRIALVVFSLASLLIFVIYIGSVVP